MEYQVPQFIDVEDKLVGPLTLKQFIYLAGTAGLCILLFSYLPSIFALLLSIPIVAFGVTLAFYKINNKPFIEVLEAGFNFYLSKKFMLWKYTAPTTEENSTAAASAAAADVAAHPVRGAPRLTRGKLSELAWSLDVPTANNPTFGRNSKQ
jgi:hypothetical protein